jgi:hypothetical protein
MKTNIIESPINIDPETGKVDYGVYHGIIQKFRDFLLYYKNTFLKNEQVVDKNDSKFNQIFEGSKYLYNQFLSNLKTHHPKEYRDIEVIINKQIREIIKTKLKEISTTGTSSTFTPGDGAQYVTPYAFNPDKKAKGTKNIYYYKLGWKPVNTKKLQSQSKTLDHKDLWNTKLNEDESTQSYINSLNLEDSSLKQFVEKKINDFDIIENKLNVLIPLLKQAKTETMEFYKNDPSFTIKYGTDLATDYLNDLITLFKKK